jgi:hypothetical protein
LLLVPVVYVAFTRERAGRPLIVPAPPLPQDGTLTAP